MIQSSPARSPGRHRSALPLATLLRGSAAVLVALSAHPCWAQTPPPPPPPPEVDTPAVPPEKPADNNSTPSPPPEAAPPAPSAPGASSGQQGGGRYLLIPDISLTGILNGHLSTDKRDQERERFRLDEAELAIQSYVYPQVKLDTFIVFDGGGGVNVEEAYLTFQNASILRQDFVGVVGRRKVPFGRVNQLHPHSWLYIVQPYALSNLVSSESLTGDGAYLSYLFPTRGIFAQIDAGFWSQSEAAEDINAMPDPTQQIVTSPGAGFADKFTTGRLYLAKEALGGSVELGGSLAGGRGVPYLLGEQSVRPDILLSGLDLTYRRTDTGTKRLLLRSEYLHHRQEDGGFKRNTDGYYVFADQRLDAYTSAGIRYDDSGFPYADGRERGISLIGTRQLTEQTYYRLQYIHGSRPGKSNFDELYFQIVFGVGPHTHNLE